MRNFIQKIRHHSNTIAFIAGFIWDNLTLNRVDQWLDNLILTSYIAVSGLGIVWLSYLATRSAGGFFTTKLTGWLPLAIQFAFGGLFSGYIIFYSQSASLVASWPFLFFLIFLFVGNELFRKRYENLTFQLSVFFIVLFSYFTFSAPVFVGKMGAWVFILSGAISLIVIALIIRFIKRFSRESFQRSRSAIYMSIAAIYVFFNLAYFTNIIPPIPLSLKEIGVYHQVSRASGDQYEFKFESASWYQPFEKTSKVFHQQNNEPVYVFSSVFAPTKLTTKIFHHWSYFDEMTDQWKKTDTFSYQIVGGRDGGYRGYSIKKSLSVGKWRVEVMTDRQQLIGRIDFEITKSAPAELKTEIR